jgi:cytoskeleton protein RodZ
MMRKKVNSAPSEPTFSGPGVCELLKTTRERAGQDLQTVSQVLRIRFVYLEAIEAGRYDELPGKTYVVGFVRAYAEHLGLDSEEVIRRFKAEVDGLEGSAELVFPSPVTEQSVPGGAIILISLIILGAAYGGWYFLSSQDRSMAELVPDLPAKFSEMMENATKSKGKVAEKTVEEGVPSLVATEEKVEAATSTPDQQDMAQKALEAVDGEESKVKDVAGSVETAKVEDAPAVAEEAVNEDVKEVIAPLVEKKAVEVVTPVVATPVVEEPKVEVVAEPVAPKPMKEVILLKAVDYSWVQITDLDGQVKHTQVLNEGDEYQIPAVQGLILRTGNAGGLEIFVDGKKAPAVGDSGQVRRKIFLDATKLLAGKAVDS